MSLSRGWLCAFFVVLAALAYCGVAPVVDAQGVNSPDSGFSDELVISGADWLVEGQSTAAEVAKRANPEAALARLSSTSAYHGLGAGSAEKLANESFRNMVVDRDGGLPRLPRGQRTSGFANAFAAQVDLGGGKHGLVESNAPLAIKGSSGAWTPIDLGLREHAGGFEGANPLVAARLPKRLDEGARLTGIGLSVTPVDAQGSPLRDSTGTVDGASVFMANTLLDSDTVWKLSTFGLSVDALLRSEKSPEQLSYRVGLPAGAKLVAARGEPGALRVVKRGKTIASMPTPSALDAGGTTVPVSVSVSGDVVTLKVAHDKGSYLYPIAVDPEFNVTSEATKLEPSYWPFSHEGAFTPGHYGEEMWMTQESGSVTGQWGAFNYVTKGNSKIYEFNVTTTEEPTQGNGSEYWVTGGESYAEIAGTDGIESHSTIAEPWVHMVEWPRKNRVCPWSNCSAESGAGGNTARVVLRATTTNGFAQLRVQSASLSISQPKTTHATVSYNNASPEVEYTSGGKLVKTANAFYGEGAWVNNSTGAFEFKSGDGGLGVSGTGVEVLKGGVWQKFLPRNYLTEGGACLGVQCAPAQKEVVTYSALSSALVNGNNTIRVAARDPMPATWSSEHGEGEAVLKVDTAAPHGIVLGGLAGGGGEYELDETVRHLTVEASDGEGATPSSGIRSIAMAIDGKEIGHTAGSCHPGPCTAKGEWVINGGEIGAGSHVMTVVATDNVGNAFTKEYLLNVYEASAVPTGPGSVNPESGNFELSATDVNMSGGTSGLQVGRSFDSRNPTAGAEGPLGPQWQISLGSMASLEVLPDGSVMVNGAEGLTHFSKNGSGGFEAPLGDSNIKLESVTKSGKITAYLLKNAMKGTTTTFTLPSGAKSWMPTVSEGPSATNTTTDEYTTAEPEAGKKIIEPLLEVAPHPSAVCAYKKLEKGCRALEFNYATSTTATGEKQSEWGDYKGRLTRVYFIAWDPAKKVMVTSTVAQYSYDAQGRLRAVWDPRISPALKTVYGYDAQGHVTALTPPGQETWAFTYGAIAGDATSGRLLRTTRAPASAPLWAGAVAGSTAAPVMTPGEVGVGVTESASAGTWSGNPVGYRYQWQRCNPSGGECSAIVGANNESYKPTFADAGHKLDVEVQAINGGGSSAAANSTPVLVAGSAPSYVSSFGSNGTGSGQFKWAQGVTVDGSGNVWVADTFNNRVEEFGSTGTFIREFGTAGTGNGQFKEPFALAVTSEGNVWVVDSGNNRVQEFSSTGVYMKQFGSEGWGESKFFTPAGIAITPEGNIWVTDSRDYRVEEFSSAGAYIRQAGEYGTGNGQLMSPKGVASDSEGNIWVTDTSDNRVEEFSPTGAYLRKFGSEGTGPGQFKETRGVTVDSAGEVWVTDRYGDRVQGFNANGEYQTQYGSSSQFNEPEGIAVSPAGMMYVADTSNFRIQRLSLSTSTLSYSSKFGSSGSEAGQMSWPQNLVLDTSGNVWVADALNNRIEEFSASGTFMKQFGTAGTGNGQLKTPEGLAITSEGNIWVVDSYNQRVEEFDESGKYIRQFGTIGAGAGQFDYPRGVAILPGSGDIAVADQGNNRVQIFTPTGGFVSEITGSGTSWQLKNPEALAADQEGHVWVADAGNNRVEEFSSSGVPICRFGSSGGGRGQFNNPSGITIDGGGDVWVTDTFNDRIEAFTHGCEFAAEYGGWGSGNGQFYDPNSIAISKTGTYYVLDAGWGRVQMLTTPAGSSEAPAAPRTEGGAMTTIEYNVPVSGTGAPYAMGSSEASKWGQTDVPTVATAIFPPDSPQGWPAPEYKRASVYYMDSHALVTNTATPNSGIATTEYNEFGGVRRSLSSANRAKALGEGAKSAEVAKLLDTQNIYANSGTRLTEVLGPQHMVKIANGNEKVPTGSEVLVREHKKYYYNEGAPETGETFNLVTKTTDGAETAAKEEFDTRTTTTSYSGQSNLGWKLRSPTSTTTDPSGLKLTRTTIYNENGVAIETRNPASGGSGDPHDVQIVYYSAETNSTYPSCGGHIEWSGLPCESLPGKQPGTSGLPELPVITTTYDIWDQPETVTEAFGSTTRTKKTTYDAAGRPLTAEATSTSGVAVPAVTNSYSTATGAIIGEKESFEGKEKMIRAEYDSLGRLMAYYDADEGMTLYTYDVDGRTTSVSSYGPGASNRGKQTYTYDASSGLLTTLADSLAGTFTASYDAGGRMLSETYPNKMTATFARNSVGATTGIEYSKTVHCASTCPEKWFSETVVPSIHGEALKQVSSLSEEPKEVYDAAGRLTEVQEIPAGLGCTIRSYGYDVESNRTSLTTRAPGAEGKCATEGGAVEAHTYDSANRLIDSGVSYDTFGNVTKLPAADAGGAEVNSSYYVDNQVATQEQGGKTTSYYMDPAGRLRETRTPTVSVTHYAGPGSGAAWTSESESLWTKNILGIDGSLAAVRASAGVITLQLHDLQGDVVATAALSETETKLLTKYNSTEFGVPTSSTPPKYGWLGAAGIATESTTGLMVQGGIAYVPQTGRPLETQGVILPLPTNAAAPYAMEIAPWVLEGTAAMAKQLTAAQEAREAAEQAQWAAEEAGYGGGGGGGSKEIGGGLELVSGEGASISAVPNCQFHWQLAEHNGSLEMAGKFRCKHAVENMEMEMCMWYKYPGRPWKGATCTGQEGRGIVVKNKDFEEMFLEGTCIGPGIVYTGQMWTHEWSGSHNGQFWSSGSIFSPGYPRLACEGPSSGDYQEIGEAFA